MLVASSCAGMGLDVGNICLVVNIGIPRFDWELKQQSGRAGRDGSQAVCVNLAPRIIRTTHENASGQNLFNILECYNGSLDIV